MKGRRYLKAGEAGAGYVETHDQTPKEHRVVDLPEVTRDSQVEAWGLPREYTGRGRDLDPNVAEMLVSGGARVVDTKTGGEWRCGLTSRPADDEYIDPAALDALLEEVLGFAPSVVRGVFRQGRKSEAQLVLRGRVDARLLELSLGGADMAALGRALGLRVVGGNSHALDSALARARSNRKESNV